MDYKFANISATVNIFNFTISPGATRSFEMTIINDNIAEYRRKFLTHELHMYSSLGVEYVATRYIYIDDDDGK